MGQQATSNPAIAALAPGSPRRVSGRRAGQREDLVARLRDLAGNYPAGIGILKEFIQNADDAGATWVRFTLDLRRHRAVELPDERMGPLFGPALLVESDQTFTDVDLENIQRIGAAGKIDDVGKTGRFGLGFNTVYSITDYPSFATRDLVMTFDPFFDAVALKEQGEDPGICWPLEALWRGGADWPRAFGLPEGATMLRTTIYRLPLRTVEQTGATRIGRTAVSPEEVRSILLSLGEWGERLVLFLRAVLRVDAFVVDDHGESVLSRVSTSNVDEVRAARVEVLPKPGTSAEDILTDLVSDLENPVVVYDHTFAIAQNGDTRAATWLVCQGMFPGSRGEVLDAARAMARVGEKAIPLGGVALRIQRVGDHIVPLTTPGTLCCTLPVPQPLGVGLVANARWSLSSDRSRVRSETSGESRDAVYVRWNHALAEHVVPSAYAALFGRMKDALDAEASAAVYMSWPDFTRLSEPFTERLAAAMYRVLAAAPSIRVQRGEVIEWRLPAEVRRSPAGWGTSLVKELIADGLALPVPPVPTHVIHGLGEESSPPELTAEECRDWLVAGGPYEGPIKTAPWRCLRDPRSVLRLLSFCSQGGTAKLDGLPLALMADKHLRTFGEGELVYLGDPVVRSIFRARRRWFLELDAETGGPVHSSQAARLLMMTPDVVIKNLRTHLPVDRDGTWSPEGDEVPNEKWLVELFGWLAKLPDLEKHLPALEHIALVPDTEGRLMRPATLDTPLLPTDSTTRRLEPALRAFGVPLAAGSPSLLKAIGEFAEKAGEMVWDATPSDVVDALARGPLPDVPSTSPHRREILNWLADALEARELSDDALAKLKGLALWPTKDGRVVAADAERTFLPRAFDPPVDFEAVTLLELGPRERWRPLLEALQVPPLELSKWLLQVFLPGYGGLAPAARLGALTWLRDLGKDALNGGTEDENPKLHKKLRETALVQGDDGELHAPSRLYSPDARDAVKVLGPIARFPDTEGVYRAESNIWTKFFDQLGLQTQPLAEDIIARVDQLLRDHTPENGDETEAALFEVYNHLAERWSKGEGHERSELALPLRERPWVPTMQRPAGDDEVAAFRAPPARFMRPGEVYPAKLVHHAASQAAFMAKDKEKPVVRDALGMPSEVTPEQVLAHFRIVRDQWAAGGAATSRPEAVGKVASALYQVVGRLAKTQSRVNNELEEIRRALAESDCIWDPEGTRFWRPDHAFRRVQASLAGLRLQVDGQAREANGLDALGRRPALAPGDYADVLRELAGRGTEPLAEAYLKAALACWKELENALDLLRPDLPVPTSEGILVPAEASLVDDATYWRDRLRDAALPWIHGEVPARAALKAGAKRVSNVVHETPETWNATPTAEVEEYCADRSTHIASDEFALGIMRLIAHAAHDAHKAHEAHEAHEAEGPDLDDIRHAVALKLVPCDALRAGLVCPEFGIDDAVGVESASCVLAEDAQPPKVWVATADPESVAIELGRALQRRLSETGIVDGAEPLNTAALESILRCKAGQVAEYLDKRKIRSLVLPSLDPNDDTHDSPGPVEEVGIEKPEPTDDEPDTSRIPPEPAPSPTRPASTEPTTNTGVRATHEGERGTHEGGPKRRDDRTGRREGATGVPPIDTPPRDRQPLMERAPPALPKGDTGEDPPRPSPTVPHLGQPTARSKRRGQFYSYLEPLDDVAGGGGRDPAPSRQATELAALAFVDATERRRGSKVTPMAPTNEGYDREVLVPGEAEVRIVEVKGLGGDWDARGVRLTPAELRAAHHFGERYWVYVVENAKDPARRRLYRIRGPANRVTAYCLDHGWKALDEHEHEVLAPAPGLTLLDGDKCIGVIDAVEQTGEAMKLTLRTRGGELRRVNWNPTRHRIQARST